ncbi:hypothetical protein OESDEN_16255, partial [Oesophagostomum dentatum]
LQTNSIEKNRSFVAGQPSQDLIRRCLIKLGRLILQNLPKKLRMCGLGHLAKNISAAVARTSKKVITCIVKLYAFLSRDNFTLCLYVQLVS